MSHQVVCPDHLNLLSHLSFAVILAPFHGYIHFSFSISLPQIHLNILILLHNIGRWQHIADTTVLFPFF